MLLEEFDDSKTAVLNPEHFVKKLENMPKTCIGFFSKTVMHDFMGKYKPEMIDDSIENATAKFPVYKVVVGGKELAVTHFPVGAPACIGNVEEIIALGANNILAVGCCGCLDKSMEEYSVIIPTAAIRDEGTSYHYASASDETIIDEKMINILENVMERNKLHYHKGKTWTTDAIFRETKKKKLLKEFHKEQSLWIWNVLP